MNSNTVLNKIMTLLSSETKKEVSFVIAKLVDGTEVESKTFDVGEAVEVIAEDGSKSPAPNGEHELFLRDEEGNEVRIRIITKDGIIETRENVEEATEEPKAEEEMSSDSEEEILEEEVKEEEVVINLEEVVKTVEEMSYRIEELEKKLADMQVEEEVEEEILEEEVKEEEVVINLEEVVKTVEEMSYRIEELEKKLADMQVEEEVEEEILEEEELPKLDGAPVMASKVTKKTAGKKPNRQSAFLSKLYN